MTDDTKIPYTQCLKHTSKKVYKYWIIALAAIFSAIVAYLVISSAWKQIADGFEYVTSTIGNAVGYIGYVLSILFNNAWSLVCLVPWYLWVVAGVIIGPFILVAIYCAGKHYNVKSDHVILIVICVISVGAVCGIFNCFLHIINLCATGPDLLIGALSLAWWGMIAIAIINLNDGGY